MKRRQAKMLSVALCITFLMCGLAFPTRGAESTFGEKISECIFKQDGGKRVIDYPEREIAMEMLDIINRIEDLDSQVETFDKAWSIFKEKGLNSRLEQYGLTPEAVKGLAEFAKVNKGSFEIAKLRQYLGLPVQETEDQTALAYAIDRRSESLKNALNEAGASDSFDRMDLLISKMDKFLELFKLSQIVHQTVYEYNLDSKKLSVLHSGVETAVDNLNLFLEKDITDIETVILSLESFTAWYNDPDTNANDKDLIYAFLKKYFFIRETGGQPKDDEPGGDTDNDNEDDSDDNKDNDSESPDDRDSNDDNDSDNGSGNQEPKDDGNKPQNKKLQDPKWDWVRNAIDELYEDGVDLLRPYEQFDPEEPVTRSEFTAMMARLFFQIGEYEDMTFIDVHENHIYMKDISGAEKADYVEGISLYERIFSPDTNMTRQEMATETANIMVTCGYERDSSSESIMYLEDYSEIADWALNNVSTLYREDMVLEQNKTKFVPKGILNFADAAMMIYKIRQLLQLQ